MRLLSKYVALGLSTKNNTRCRIYIVHYNGQQLGQSTSLYMSRSRLALSLALALALALDLELALSSKLKHKF